MHRKLIALAIVLATAAPAFALPPLPDDGRPPEPTQYELEWIMEHGKEIDAWVAAAQATPRQIVEWNVLLVENENGIGCTEEWIDMRPNWDALIGVLAAADVVLIGEHHGDPATHRMELALVSALQQRRGEKLAVAMEMFERDVQWTLDNYTTAGQFGMDREEKFLAHSRPWPSYATDYRPLMEFLRWRFIRGYASNAPTELARRVSKEGLEPVLASLSPEQLGWLAAETTAPRDAYWEAFLAAMSPSGSASGPAHGQGMSEEQIYGYYVAQTLKDDTMAETIARLREEDPARQVVNLSGSFHIDNRHGIVSRLLQRRPSDRVVTVAIRALEDFEPSTLGSAMDAEQAVADFVIYVQAEAPVPAS